MQFNSRRNRWYVHLTGSSGQDNRPCKNPLAQQDCENPPAFARTVVIKSTLGALMNNIAEGRPSTRNNPRFSGSFEVNVSHWFNDYPSSSDVSTPLFPLRARRSVTPPPATFHPEQIRTIQQKISRSVFFVRLICAVTSPIWELFEWKTWPHLPTERNHKSAELHSPHLISNNFVCGSVLAD